MPHLQFVGKVHSVELQFQKPQPSQLIGFEVFSFVESEDKFYRLRDFVDEYLSVADFVAALDLVHGLC